MQIQWYPGHMHKASKEISELLGQIDLVLEVLDARIPFSSQNPMLNRMQGSKPCIKILNKSDLADPDMTRTWQAYLEQEKNVKTLAVSNTEAAKIKRLPELCQKILPDKTRRNKLIQSVIVGIPNVGKSTLINILAGKTIARTGNEPAVTKRQQRIDLDCDIILSDTPGVLWPNVENRNSGYRLAATGAIRDTAIEHADLAYFTAEFLLQHYPDKLLGRFQLSKLPATPDSLLDAIGRQRGCLRPGGVVDMDKTAKILLVELRSGKLGRISMETPSMMEQELVELNRIREAKAAKKEARKQKWKNT